MELIVTVNLAAFIIFLLSISAYAIKLRTSITKPSTAKRGLLNIFYAQWVLRMSESKEKIVAVQTLRNLIMSVTFLSSSILVLLGLLVRAFSGGIDNIFFNFSQISAIDITQYKFLLLFAVLIFSLIMFLLSLRQMVRFTILIGIPSEEIQKKGTEKIEENSDTTCTLDARDLQSEVFLKAMNRFTFGLRGVFYAVTVLLWFITSYAFIVATLILTVLLIHFHDVRKPCVEETPI